jgi:hypothetical protein
MAVSFGSSIRQISCLIIVLGVGCSSLAQADEGTPEQRAACTTDAFRLCASSIPNVQAVKACMVMNKAKLSTGCRATFPKRTASR